MSENNKIDIKDIHQTFWRCRDFELSNLWQRSVFLTAFLVLCFTAYGTVLIKLLEKVANSVEEITFIGLNIVAYFLAIIGVIISILWIKMSKGSKAWYEVYESAINALETNEEYTTKEACKIGGFSYTNLPRYRGVQISNSLFSTKAGEYSVSKLNIGIGQVFLVLWSLINLTHTTGIAILLQNNNKNQSCAYIGIFILCICILSFTLWLFGRSKAFASSSMEWFKKSK